MTKVVFPGVEGTGGSVERLAGVIGGVGQFLTPIEVQKLTVFGQVNRVSCMLGFQQKEAQFFQKVNRNSFPALFRLVSKVLFNIAGNHNRHGITGVIVSGFERAGKFVIQA